MMGVSANDWQVIACSPRTKWGYGLCDLGVLETVSVRFLVAPTVVASSTTSVGTGMVLKENIFRSVWNIPLTHFSRKVVASRAWTAKFLMISNITHSRFSPFWMCNKVFPTTSTVLLAANFSRPLWQRRIECSKSG